MEEQQWNFYKNGDILSNRVTESWLEKGHLRDLQKQAEAEKQEIDPFLKGFADGIDQPDSAKKIQELVYGTPAPASKTATSTP